MCDITLVDPESKADLIKANEGGQLLQNVETGQTYRQVDGVWRMLRPAQAAQLAQFIQEYEAIRMAEGRGSADSAYYRALPYHDLSGKMTEAWRIRAASFDTFCQNVMPRLAPNGTLFDLGAGNCWLSASMTAKGFKVAAVDLLVNPLDGLGAAQHYPETFLRVQSTFDWLPFSAESADCVLFNASFHYATSYDATLQEALRVLKPQGSLVILDTPIYKRVESGRQMVRERETQFKQTYGFASNSLPSENFLTWRRLEELAQQFGLTWTMYTPRFGFKWALRPLRAALRGRREPATFRLIIGHRRQS